MQIAYAANDDIRAAIARLGRTEDVHFSPDNRRLAIAGLKENRVLVLDITIDLAAGDRIVFTDYLEVTSPALRYPHGLFWIDDTTLIIANRGGDVPILKLPIERPASRLVEVSPVQTIRAKVDLLKSPGSVSVSDIGLDLHEVLICNNYGNYLSRHVLDGRADFALIASSIVLSEGLKIPDGVAYTRSADWIAVSNHREHVVCLYRNDARLHRDSRPAGLLLGVDYPHGLRFTGDGRVALVADAGAPFIHVYASPDGDWSGERRPVAALQAVDDATFSRGHYNVEEGGPKGLDVSRDDRVLAVTCEEEPIVFFDLRDMLAAHLSPAADQAAGRGARGEADMARAALLRNMVAMQPAQGEVTHSRLQAEALSEELAPANPGG